MSEEKTGLKNCPFCNSDNIKLESNNDPYYPEDFTFSIICDDCLAMGGKANSQNQAKVLWNMRSE
jgi:hypothetical protein